MFIAINKMQLFTDVCGKRGQVNSRGEPVARPHHRLVCAAVPTDVDLVCEFETGHNRLSSSLKAFNIYCEK